jgi:hypothetical protein
MVLVIALLALQSSFDLFPKVIKNPTGNNGYEEYVRAADSLRSTGISNLIGWSPDQLKAARQERQQVVDFLAKAKSEIERADWKDELESLDARIKAFAPLEGKSLLEVRRLMVARGLKTYSLLEAGNRKPVFSPRTSLTLETLYPEYASFKSLARFLSAKAFVEAADGNALAASRTLAEGYKFVSRTGSETLIARLVSIAGEAILHAALEDLLPTIPERGIDGLDAALRLCLPETPFIVNAFESEGQFVDLTLKELEKQPAMFGSMWGDPDDEEVGDWKKYQKEFEGLSPAARQRLFRGVVEDSRSRRAKIAQLFTRPESEWFEYEEPTNDGTLQGYLVEALAPTFIGAFSAEARARTQARLGRLSCSIIAFRWRNGRLPGTLAEAVDKANLHDPLSGKEFEYAPLPGGAFRLVSKGNKQTGEIALRYKRASAKDNGDDLP